MGEEPNREEAAKALRRRGKAGDGAAEECWHLAVVEKCHDNVHLVTIDLDFKLTHVECKYGVRDVAIGSVLVESLRIWISY